MMKFAFFGCKKLLLQKAMKKEPFVLQLTL